MVFLCLPKKKRETSSSSDERKLDVVVDQKNMGVERHRLGRVK